MKRKYTELRHDRRVQPFFFFYPAKKRKSCSCCQTQHRVFRAAASCCCCRGSKVRLQAKEEQQQMLFSRFPAERNAFQTKSHRRRRANGGPASERILNHFPRFCVFTERAHTVPGLSAPSGNQFSVLLRRRTQTRGTRTRTCALNLQSWLLLTTLSWEN